VMLEVGAFMAITSSPLIEGVAQNSDSSRFKSG
jgi:hypothetical protein